jgi:hypothetical protein
VPQEREAEGHVDGDFDVDVAAVGGRIGVALRGMDICGFESWVWLGCEWVCTEIVEHIG